MNKINKLPATSQSPEIKTSLEETLINVKNEAMENEKKYNEIKTKNEILEDKNKKLNDKIKTLTSEFNNFKNENSKLSIQNTELNNKNMEIKHTYKQSLIQIEDLKKIINDQEKQIKTEYEKNNICIPIKEIGIKQETAPIGIKQVYKEVNNRSGVNFTHKKGAQIPRRGL